MILRKPPFPYDESLWQLKLDARTRIPFLMNRVTRDIKWLDPVTLEYVVFQSLELQSHTIYVFSYAKRRRSARSISAAAPVGAGTPKKLQVQTQVGPCSPTPSGISTTLSPAAATDDDVVWDPIVEYFDGERWLYCQLDVDRIMSAQRMAMPSPEPGVEVDDAPSAFESSATAVKTEVLLRNLLAGMPLEPSSGLHTLKLSNTTCAHLNIVEKSYLRNMQHKQQPRNVRTFSTQIPGAATGSPNLSAEGLHEQDLHHHHIDIGKGVSISTSALLSLNEDPQLGSDVNSARPTLSEVYKHGCALVSVTDGILATGGFADENMKTVTGTTRLYEHTGVGRIHELPTLTTPRASHALAVVDASTSGRLIWFAFAIGGFDGVRKTAAVERYVLGTNRWEIMNSMGIPRSGHASVVADGVVYVFGGRSGYNVMRSGESMHPQTDTWTPTAPMRSARSNFGIEFLSPYIMVAGGWDGKQWLASVEAYDPRIDGWRDVRPMNHPRACGFGMCVMYLPDLELVLSRERERREHERFKQQSLLPR